MARLLVSFALVIGILVAGLTHRLAPGAAQAQTESAPVSSTSLSIGLSLSVSSGEVVGPVISAYGVSINGVPTDFVLGGKVEVLDGFLISDDTTTVNGVGVSGNINETPKDGVGVSGNVTEEPQDGVGVSGNLTEEPQDGVGVSGNVMVSDVIITSEYGVQVSGGELLGDNISIEGGVLTGDNLRIVGATVTGSGLSVTNAPEVSPGS